MEHSPSSTAPAGHVHTHNAAEDWRAELRTTAICFGALVVAWFVHERWPAAGWALFAVSYAAGALGPLKEALHDLRHGSLNVDFLMILVAAGAAALGHPEEGAMLLVLFGASRTMESWAHERTRNAIQELMRDFPREATVVEGDAHRTIAVADVAPGMKLLVRPGDTIPVDSRVVDGVGSADVSAINGESEPLALAPGTEVPSGAVNGMDVVVVEALRLPTESAWQKIVRLVESAPDRKSDAQIVGDRVGAWFTWTILSASAIGFVAWRFGMELTTGQAAYRAMALLVAGSPCALVLSIPSAVMAAIAAGARRGALFNGGKALHAASHIRTIVFDKTGTLTTGEPSVARVEGPSAGDERFLAVARALAHSSKHPASRAVATHLDGGERAEIDSVREIAGQGVVAGWEGRVVQLGRDPEPAGVQHRGGIVALSVDGRAAVRFLLTETLRPGVARVVGELRARGLHTMILSGDRAEAVETVAAQVGVDEARGALRPEDKHRLVAESVAAGRPVMMVGDGINDVPALAAATCGAAMGMRGSAAALAQADIVLTHDRLDDLVGAMDLASSTRKIIRQNMTIAIGAAATLVAFAVAGNLPLVAGVFGHEGGTVLVVLNSLRLLAGSSGIAAKSVAQTALSRADLRPNS